MYRLMAGAHRYAIDYIEQAPVIVLAAAHGNAHVSWSERAFIQEQLRKVCESKAQLRDVMRSYGLPLPLLAVHFYRSAVASHGSTSTVPSPSIWRRSGWGSRQKRTCRGGLTMSDLEGGTDVPLKLDHFRF